MIDPGRWKQKILPVTSLQLDPRNPRIPERKSAPSQPELVAELIAHDNVYDLARDIAEVGYLPDSALIAVVDGGRTIVVEGNRRLTALKLLISPSLAPSDAQSRFRKLSEKVTLSHIRKVRVVIAPSRDAASLIIQRKHTRTQVEKWSPAMQARFYYERIEDGTTIAELAQEFSIPPGEITEFLQSHQMYSIACTLDLPPEVATKVRNPREFPLTNLDRAYRSARAAKFLGISFDESRQVKGHVDPVEFKKGYAKIVSDIALGNMDSRTLNDAAGFDKYLKAFGAATPDLTKKGSFTGEDLTKSPPPKGIAAAKKGGLPPAKSPKAQKALVGKAFVCTSTDARINGIVKELKKLSIEDYPNAVGTLLRVLVDLTVSQYADQNGVSKALIEKAQQDPKSPKGADWYPSARQLLNRMISDGQSLKLPPLVLKAAKKLVADDQAPFSVAILDAYVHNRHVIPSSTELRSFWSQLEEALKIMLTPPHTDGPQDAGGQ
jgi:hypothetical protein